MKTVLLLWSKRIFIAFTSVPPFFSKASSLLLLLILSGCGGGKTSIPITTTVYENSNPIFDEFIESFYTAQKYWTGAETRKHVPTNFVADDFIPLGKVNSIYNGTCSKFMIQHVILTREIFIKESYWNSVDDIGKQHLIDHEMGHCILDREHTDTQLFVHGETYSVVVYDSIMYAYCSGPILENYKLYNAGYMQELFTGSTELLEEMIREKYDNQK